MHCVPFEHHYYMRYHIQYHNIAYYDPIAISITSSLLLPYLNLPCTIFRRSPIPYWSYFRNSVVSGEYSLSNLTCFWIGQYGFFFMEQGVGLPKSDRDGDGGDALKD